MINKRFLAQIIIEAKTPLKIGSGESDFFTDAPVQKDVNGLPMILGTSIAGVLRDRFKNVLKEEENKLFGFQEYKNNEGEGSRLIVSNALLCDDDLKVMEGICDIDKIKNNEFLKNYLNLPLRDHTAITEKGTAKEHSKFDEEVVYKGSRFKFELEVVDDIDDMVWGHLLFALKSDGFRIGGGATKGFGELKIVKIQTKVLDLNKEDELELYINKTSSLNDDFKWDSFDQKTNNLYKNRYIKYTLELKPDDFFMFGSGFGDKEADNTPKKEKIIKWNDNKGYFTDEVVLIPASSIKGALSHRTAFYYNKQMLEQNKEHTKTSENNEAVKAIFGHKKEIDKKTKKELGQKGKILISDCFKEKKETTKTFDHVAIDRFTGGAIEGALFQEKTIADDGEYYKIVILLEKDIKDEYVKAFESALKDITTGMLPLGGATTKGHGVFCGKVFKDGVQL